MREWRVNNTTIRLIQGDITDLAVEAFVYYAEPTLKLGAGFGNAISNRGGAAVKAELAKMPPIQVGDAVVSGAGDMKARCIVHAVGPRFQEENTEAKLEATMQSVLRKAEEKGLGTLAFPPMGCGFYGVPLDLSARVMVASFCKHLNGKSSLGEVVVCVRDARELKPFEEAMKALA